MSRKFQSVKTEPIIKSPSGKDGLANKDKKFNSHSTQIPTPRLDSETIKETELSVFDEIIEGNIDVDEVKSLGLTAEDFDSETHRLIFEAMERIHDRGAPVDTVALSTELKGIKKRPDGAEWLSYIIHIINLAAPIEDVAYHVGIIKEAARLRRLSEAHYRAYEAAKERDAEEIREWSERIAELNSQGEVNTRARCIILAHHDPKPKPWIIKGLIPDGFPSMIYGAGGMGKSFLSAYLGIEACRGDQKFLGHTFPEEPLNTLIIDYELDADVQAERAQKIAQGLNLAGIPENLHYYAPTKVAARALPEFKGLIKRHGIRFVIIDSWGGSGVDGNNPEDTAVFLKELRDLGIATLILDHQSKTQTGESYDSKTAFGSVYKFNMCRSVFQLSRTGDTKNPMTLQLRHKKSNFGPLVDDLILDVCFEGDRVLFTESSIQSSEERDLELVGDAIVTLESSGGKVNQKRLAEYLKGVMGHKRLRHLLEKGDGQLWETQSGNRNEKTYKSKTAKRHPLSKYHFAVIESSDVGNCLKPPPDELF